MPDGIRVDVEGFKRVNAVTREDKVGSKIKREMRAGLKKAGEVGAQAARDEVRKPPLQQSDRHRTEGRRGLRAALASGIKVTIQANQGAIIKTTASGLDPARKKLVKRYNREKGWKHPVFARYGQRQALKAASKATRGGARRSLRGLDRAFAERDRANAKWVSQVGRPYFGTAIWKKEPIIASMVSEAINTAVDKVAAEAGKGQ